MLRYYFVLLCLVTIVCGIVCVNDVDAYDNNDYQSWQTLAARWQINDRLQFGLEDQFRIGKNSTDFYYNHVELDLLGEISDYISLGGGFRYIYKKNQSKSAAWKSEYRPMMTGLLKFGSDKVEFSSMNRFEYRAIDGASNKWFYRNKFTLLLPTILRAAEVRPYLADEIFVNLNNGNFNENRIYGGFRVKPVKHMIGNIYYLRQSFETTKWKSNNIMGVKVTILF